MRTKIVIMLALPAMFAAGFFATPASAQELSSVEITPDVRSAGMGGSTLALDATPFSPVMNMAAVSRSDYKWSAAYSFTSWLGKDDLHAMSGWGRIGERHSIGASLRWFAREAIETTEDGVLYRTVKPYDVIADAGYAFSIVPTVSLGAGVRYINAGPKEIAVENALAGNVSLQYHEKGWRAALVLDNLGGRLGAEGGSMPATLRVGGGYQHVFVEKHRLSLSMQADYRFMAGRENHVHGGVGLEYAFLKYFALSGGYHVSDRERSFGNYGSVGASLFLGPVVVEAAYLITEHPVDHIWRVGAGVRF